MLFFFAFAAVPHSRILRLSCNGVCCEGGDANQFVTHARLMLWVQHMLLRSSRLRLGPAYCRKVYRWNLNKQPKHENCAPTKIWYAATAMIATSCA